MRRPSRALVLVTTLLVWLPSTLLAMHLDALRVLARPELADGYELTIKFQYFAFWLRYGWMAMLWLFAVLVFQSALLRRSATAQP